MSASVKRFVFSILGLGLGGVFVYAGIQKHLAPYEFAEAILAYQLLPFGLVGPVAATLPWLEMVSGFSLALGYLLRGPPIFQPDPAGSPSPARRPPVDFRPVAPVCRRAAHHHGPGAENRLRLRPFYGSAGGTGSHPGRRLAFGGAGVAVLARMPSRRSGSFKRKRTAADLSQVGFQAPVFLFLQAFDEFLEEA